MRLTALVVVLSSLMGIAEAQDQSSPGKLPVKRVVLFKNGVGYFEHTGKVHGNQSVFISFTSGQLNDVLKSLTVLDQSGGRISGIAYGTAAPIGRRMGDACGNLSSRSTQADLLNAVRGSRILLHSGATDLTGRVLGVEEKQIISGNLSADGCLSIDSERGRGFEEC